MVSWTRRPSRDWARDRRNGVRLSLSFSSRAAGRARSTGASWRGYCAVGLTLEQFVAVVADEQYTAPIPDMLLLAGSAFGTVTDGIGANTNYGPMANEVEEWVMPN